MSAFLNLLILYIEFLIFSQISICGYKFWGWGGTNSKIGMITQIDIGLNIRDKKIQIMVMSAKK